MNSDSSDAKNKMKCLVGRKVINFELLATGFYKLEFDEGYSLICDEGGDIDPDIDGWFIIKGRAKKKRWLFHCENAEFFQMSFYY